MADFTERLKFILTADADSAIKGFEKTGDAAERGLKKADSGVDKLGGTLTKTGAGAVAFAGVVSVGILKTVGSFNDLAIEAGKGADATGLAVDEWSRWLEVAGDVGVEANTIQGSFQKFNKAVADGKPSIAEYGVEIVKTKDGVVDANASFINAIDVIGKIEDPTKRAAAAQELFGRGYGEIAELIETGADGVRTALAAVSDQKVIDQGELDRARDYRASMDALGDAAQDLAIAIGQGATPVIGGFAEAASKAIGFVGTLNEKTDGATGKFLTMATAGLGVVGALSVVAGQTIKLRDRFTTLGADGSRSLTGLGKAAGVAGGAVTALGVSIAALQIIDSFRDNVGDTTAELQHFQSTAGAASDDLYPLLDAFTQLAEAKFDKDGSLSKGLTLIGEGFDQTKINAEGMGKAFEEVLAQSPEQAQQLIDAMMALSGEVNAGNTAAQDFAEYWGINGEIVRGWQSRVDDAAGAQQALTGEVVDGETAVDRYGRAVGDATTDTDGYITAADRAKASTDAWTQSWDILTGRFDTEEAWLNLSKQFDELKTQGAEAMKAVEEGSMTAEDAVRDQRLGTLDLISATGTYLQEVLKIPAERATAIIALIDQGKLDEAETAIALATLPREVDVRLKVSNTGAVTAILGGGRSASASGGPMFEGQTTRVNDGGRPEMWVNDKGEQFMLAPSNGHVVANPNVRPASNGTSVQVGPNYITQVVDVDAMAQRLNMLLAAS